MLGSDSDCAQLTLLFCIALTPGQQCLSFIKSFDELTDFWWIYFLYNNNTNKNNNRAINWIIFYSRQTVTSASWFDEFCILTSKSIVIVTDQERERDPAVAHEDNNLMLSKEYTNKYTLITKAQNPPSHSIINCASRGPDHPSIQPIQFCIVFRDFNSRPHHWACMQIINLFKHPFLPPRGIKSWMNGRLE